MPGNDVENATRMKTAFSTVNAKRKKKRTGRSGRT